MVFSSQVFLFWFLPAALALYFAAPRRRRHLVLTIESYVFYGWATPAFVLVMLLSTVIDWVAGRTMAHDGLRVWNRPPARLPEGAPRSRVQRAALLASVLANLGLLGFFKYFNFGVDSWNALAEGLGRDGWRLDAALRVALPLGISFYTFQSMSYSIDVYRGRVTALASFTDFACYVSMFPQLVAGPIVRFADVEAQMRRRTHSLAKFARGAACVSLGLGKKVLLANPMGEVADACFGAASLGPVEAWWGALAYAFQIYFDFSGYSDMAIGLGLMIGFTFPENFLSPYRAESVTDFWRRWHVSLSSWLRDYLYVPLGGNRLGNVRTYANLAAVMLLGGLWHGAAWNFVVWGGWHGLLLAVERAGGKRPVWTALPPPLRVAATFLLVLAGWVLFRAESLGAAGRYLAAMAGQGSSAGGAALLPGVVYGPLPVAVMAACAAVAWGGTRTWRWTERLPAWKAAALVALFALGAGMLTVQAYNPFIYFIF